MNSMAVTLGLWGTSARDGELHEMSIYGHFMGSHVAAPRAHEHALSIILLRALRLIQHTLV